VGEEKKGKRGGSGPTLGAPPAKERSGERRKRSLRGKKKRSGYAGKKGKKKEEKADGRTQTERSEKKKKVPQKRGECEDLNA